jgi:hypothetical protein
MLGGAAVCVLVTRYFRLGRHGRHGNGLSYWDEMTIVAPWGVGISLLCSTLSVGHIGPSGHAQQLGNERDHDPQGP